MKPINRLLSGVVFLTFAFSALAAEDGRWSRSRAERGLHGVESIQFTLPAGWRVDQDARSHDILILGLARGEDYLSLRVVNGGSFNFKSIIDPKAVYTSDNQAERVGPLSWDTLQYQYMAAGVRAAVHVKTFTTEFLGKRYYGWARSGSAAGAESMVKDFLSSLMVQPVGGGRSLTAVGFTGKKYYVGFGDSLSGFMGNEVKYDINHTHDIFTKDIGGSYIGTKLIGSGVGSSQLRSKWKDLKAAMTKDDMYVQYSSGHGSHSGLMFGVSYDEIRDNALSYPASEIVIFIMSCYSGNLVSSFDKKKNVWQNWQNEGRTLMVLASSKPSEESSTGPGKDPEEPGGPSGSAGSAFGHSLWKALIGHADGFVDGVKDGFISLGEIRDFTTWKTKQVGGHTPVATGTYNTGLVMNRVPTARELEQFLGGTEGLTDDEIMERIQALDDMMAVR